MRGLLIALEGLDGTGKSTAARGLAASLGAAPLSTPGTALAEARAVLDAAFVRDPIAAQLFYASTVVAASGDADRIVASGRDVVVDRYWLSTVVNAPLRGDSVALPQIERLLRPADVTFVLELEEPIRRARLAARGMTAHDRRTLEPELAGHLRHSYRAELRRPVAGRGLVVDVTGLDEAALVATLVHLVARERDRIRARASASLRAASALFEEEVRP